MHFYFGNDSYAQSVALVDDSDSPNATNFGAGWEGALDRTTYLVNQSAAISAANWSTPVTWGFTPTSNAAWDPKGKRWVMGETSGPAVYESYDGANWTQLGASLTVTPGQLVKWIVCHPTNGTVVAMKPNTSNACVLDPTADTWTQGAAPALPTNGIMGGDYIAGGGGKFLFWSSKPSAAAVLFSSDATGLGYSADLGSNWPANFANSGATVYTILSAQNSSRIVWMSSKPGLTQYSHSTDATTFTTATMPALGVTEFVTGLTYCPVLGYFFFSTYDLTSARIYRSPTGLTGSWVLAYTFTGQPGQGVVANSGRGSSVIATMQRTGINNYTVVFSQNGGATWKVARFNPVNVPGTLYSAKGNQLLYGDTANVSTSLAYPETL